MVDSRAGGGKNKETGENPDAKPLSLRQQRRKRQRELLQQKKAEQVKVAPVLQMGGRPRALDPDQAGLDRSMKLIQGLGTINATKAETAAALGVHEDTLAQFFERYPEALNIFEDARKVGISSVRRHQFALSEKSPQMAIYLGEQWAGQRDPYKMRELDQREKALELRERDVAAREKLVELRAPADLGSGLPIDINSLSLAQLMQLRDRIMALQNTGGGLTIDAVASREPEKIG